MSDESSTSLPLFAAEVQIALQVGERRFTTTRQTLVAESCFFASLLSERWDNAQDDGSYFIDADPDLFHHVLRYLRRGILPIFYDKAKGHDESLYIALLGEAKYFQIPHLQKWLEEKRYFNAVKIRRFSEEVDHNRLISETLPTNVDVEFHPHETTKKVYICPRGIPVHREITACGAACSKARGIDDVVYEEVPVLKLVMIKKEVIFDKQACMLSES